MVGTLILVLEPNQFTEKEETTLRSENPRLRWQSKAVLLLVAPWSVIHVCLQSDWWFRNVPSVAWTNLGISALFGLIVWRMRAGTLGAAATGAAITASLMFSTTRYPYQNSWLHSGLIPLLAVFLLTYAATKAGRGRKEAQGTAESKRGRNAAQVCANLGAAALVASLGPLVGTGNRLIWLNWVEILAIAALAEAAADTVSSEIGQAFGGQPRMLTSMRRVEPGTDGAITMLGTVAGILAAALVAGIGTICAYNGYPCRPNVSGCSVATPGLIDQLAVFLVVTAGGIFGLVFDSLLGASLEPKGWLNNDAVNFLSTCAAPGFALALAAAATLLLAH